MHKISIITASFEGNGPMTDQDLVQDMRIEMLEKSVADLRHWLRIILMILIPVAGDSIVNLVEIVL